MNSYYIILAVLFISFLISVFIQKTLEKKYNYPSITRGEAFIVFILGPISTLILAGAWLNMSNFWSKPL